MKCETDEICARSRTPLPRPRSDIVIVLEFILGFSLLRANLARLVRSSTLCLQVSPPFARHPAGAVLTRNAKDLLVGANMVWTATSGPGSSIRPTA